MNAHVKISLRLLAALAVAGAVIVAGGWASASGRTATPSFGTATNATASTAAWCCTDSGGQGLTVSGQATVRGKGTAARDEAIGRAVADATDQARTAASASGITLGQIVDMQVSTSSSFPYPIPIYGGAGSTGEVAPTTNVPTTSACAPGAGCQVSGPAASSSAPATPCVCTPSRAMVVQQWASVTITWAIG